MPIADWDDPATWARWYLCHPRRITKPQWEKELVLHYSRVAYYRRRVELARALEAALGWTAAADPAICVQGCGYAWTVEALEGMGYTRVVGADTSAYIQGAQDDTEEADVDAAIVAAGMDPVTGRGLEHKESIYVDPGPKGRASRKVKDEDGLSQGSWNRLKRSVDLSGNDDFDWLVSEYLLEILSDAEILQGLPHYANHGNAWVHLISGAAGPGSEPDGNWKGAAGWRAWLDANGFPGHQLFVGPTGEVL